MPEVQHVLLIRVQFVATNVHACADRCTCYRLVALSGRNSGI